MSVEKLDNLILRCLSSLISGPDDDRKVLFHDEFEMAMSPGGTRSVGSGEEGGQLGGGRQKLTRTRTPKTKSGCLTCKYDPPSLMENRADRTQSKAR